VETGERGRPEAGGDGKWLLVSAPHLFPAPPPPPARQPPE
jgi:hypothetical protein